MLELVASFTCTEIYIRTFNQSYLLQPPTINLQPTGWCLVQMTDVWWKLFCFSIKVCSQMHFVYISCSKNFLRMYHLYGICYISSWFFLILNWSICNDSISFHYECYSSSLVGDGAAGTERRKQTSDTICSNITWTKPWLFLLFVYQLQFQTSQLMNAALWQRNVGVALNAARGTFVQSGPSWRRLYHETTTMREKSSPVLMITYIMFQRLTVSECSRQK